MRSWAGVQCRAAVVCYFRADEHVECALWRRVLLRRCVFECLCTCYSLIADDGSVWKSACVAVLLCRCVAVSLCCCVAVCVTLRCIGPGRSLWL
jgi:hypothetical protein